MEVEGSGLIFDDLLDSGFAGEEVQVIEVIDQHGVELVEGDGEIQPDCLFAELLVEAVQGDLLQFGQEGSALGDGVVDGEDGEGL